MISGIAGHILDLPALQLGLWDNVWAGDAEPLLIRALSTEWLQAAVGPIAQLTCFMEFNRATSFLPRKTCDI